MSIFNKMITNIAEKNGYHLDIIEKPGGTVNFVVEQTKDAYDYSTFGILFYNDTKKAIDVSTTLLSERDAIYTHGYALELLRATEAALYFNEVIADYFADNSDEF